MRRQGRSNAPWPGARCVCGGGGGRTVEYFHRGPKGLDINCGSFTGAEHKDSLSLKIDGTDPLRTTNCVVSRRTISVCSSSSSSPCVESAIAAKRIVINMSFIRSTVAFSKESNIARSELVERRRSGTGEQWWSETGCGGNERWQHRLHRHGGGEEVSKPSSTSSYIW